jgi:hypothetical protein
MPRVQFHPPETPGLDVPRPPMSAVLGEVTADRIHPISFKAAKSLTIPPVEIKLCLWARSTVPASCPRVRGDRPGNSVVTMFPLATRDKPALSNGYDIRPLSEGSGFEPRRGFDAWVPASHLELMLELVQFLPYLLAMARLDSIAPRCSDYYSFIPTRLIFLHQQGRQLLF